MRQWNSLRKRVGELTGNLGEIESSVKDAVAEAVGGALARVAKDAVDSLLGRGRMEPLPTSPYRHHSYRHDPHREHDPWAESDPWHEDDPWGEEAQDYRQSNEVIDRPALRNPKAGALAAGLAASGWWLGRGTPVGALLAGLAAAALTFLAGNDQGIGGRIADAASRVLGLRTAAGN